MDTFKPYIYAVGGPHIPPLEGQMYAHVNWREENYKNWPDLVRDIEEANVITSRVANPDPWLSHGVEEGTHKVVIDIDGIDVKVLPSTNPGNYHLYIDKEMPWPVYLNLLRALELAGIIEPGYFAASEQRGFTALRLPWVKKGSNEPDSD